jgi:hypothetical protein
MKITDRSKIFLLKMHLYFNIYVDKLHFLVAQICLSDF